MSKTLKILKKNNKTNNKIAFNNKNNNKLSNKKLEKTFKIQRKNSIKLIWNMKSS